MPPSVSLELLAPRHVEDIEALLDDPEILRFTRIPEPTPPGYASTWVARYEAGRTDGTREGFAAVAPDGALLGLALAPDINREGRELELGYLVAPEARGRGVATEILRLLTDWAFSELDAQRAYLIIDLENPASERVAVRCGYLREGVMRSLHVKQGIRRDATLWSRLPTDPAPS